MLYMVYKDTLTTDEYGNYKIVKDIKTNHLKSNGHVLISEERKRNNFIY